MLAAVSLGRFRPFVARKRFSASPHCTRSKEPHPAYTDTLTTMDPEELEAWKKSGAFLVYCEPFLSASTLSCVALFSVS